MIKAVILDVDGVIIGEKIGFNSPYPHIKVIKTLKTIRTSGIPISLCTAKPYFAIDKIIKDAKLDNPHITDGGAVIIDPIDNILVKKHIIQQKLAQQVIHAYLKEKVYIEFYTVDDYFVQQSQICEITKQHIHILQRNPKIVPSLLNIAQTLEITHIMPIAKNAEDKKRLARIFEPFKNRLMLSWGLHPVALPLQFGIITAPDVSKKQGAVEISKNLKIPFKKILGIGDSYSDWQFIELCDYGATMGNATQELKNLVLTKGKTHSYVGPSVDENGILEILKYFIH